MGQEGQEARTVTRVGGKSLSNMRMSHQVCTHGISIGEALSFLKLNFTFLLTGFSQAAIQCLYKAKYVISILSHLRTGNDD